MITAIGDVMRRCYERGWITTRDGNCSLRRRNSSILYITPSGCRKTIIHPEHVIKCKLLADEIGAIGISTPKNSTPSGELEMHFLLTKDAQKCRAVLHVHPTYTIAAMFAGWDLQALASEFPEVSRYTKVGPSVPVLPVTSKILATTTAEMMGVCPVSGKLTYDIVGQANHGVCAVARNPWDAYEHVERLEHICQIALCSGRDPRSRDSLNRLEG